MKERQIRIVFDILDKTKAKGFDIMLYFLNS